MRVASRPLVLGCLLIPGAFLATPSVGQGDPARVGRWEAPKPWPITGIHAAVLPTAEVMHLTYLEVETELETAATVWNPRTGNFRDVSPGFGDMFCAGHSLLPSGELFVAGGFAGLEQFLCNGRGVKPAHIFDPFSYKWRKVGNMSFARFYPTVFSLADGRQLIIGGQGENCQYIPIMETLSLDEKLNRVRGPSRIMKDYPRAFLLSDGRVVHVGVEPTTSYLDKKLKFWKSVTVTNLGRIRYEPTAFYVPGYRDRVMICGGYQTEWPDGTRDNPTATCEAIDALSANPSWRSMAPMAAARGDINSVILPDGKVLVVGGGEHHRYTAPRLKPELYDPATNTWTTMAPERFGRMYHSTAVLLPDGRVLSAGQDNLDGTAPESGKWGEIFSPPYLFRGKRPVVRGVPADADYDSTIPMRVKKTKAAKVGRVVLIGLSAVTHSHNSGQRYVPLEFTPTGKRTLEAKITANANLAPPGYYMLFVLNDKGVPSVAQIIRINLG
ncbi:MAG: DUF1929 domain-containing protein [Acidobacteriota bacterium]|nr:DUF1929 domain-containing protein [Acidobacteriota bacterium]